jgi:hypothetical protein
VRLCSSEVREWQVVGKFEGNNVIDINNNYWYFYGSSGLSSGSSRMCFSLYILAFSSFVSPRGLGAVRRLLSCRYTALLIVANYRLLDVCGPGGVGTERTCDPSSSSSCALLFC